MKAFLFANVPLSMLHFILFLIFKGFLGQPGFIVADALGAAGGPGALRSPSTRRPGIGGWGRPLAIFKSEAGSANSASITLGWQGFVPEVRGESRWTINYERPSVRAQT